MKIRGAVSVNGVSFWQRSSTIGLPEFDLGLVTAFLVKENISPKGIEARQNAIEQGYMMSENISKTDIGDQKLTQVAENGHEETQKRSDLTISDNDTRPKRSELVIDQFPSMLIKNVYELLKMNRKAQHSVMADNLGVSESTIKRTIAWLKENGYINPEHSKIKGEWLLL